MVLKCWPWAHHWKAWAVLERGNRIRTKDLDTRMPLEQPQIIGQYVIQERICLHCGKIQLREAHS